MAIDRVLHLNYTPRSEIEAVREERDELLRLIPVELKACGQSDAWYAMCGKADELSDLLAELERSARVTGV